MLIPNLAPPVIRPASYEPAVWLIAFGTDPETGSVLTRRDFVPGPDHDPGDPQRFRTPVSCGQECAIFSGLALSRCLASCR